MMLAKFARPTLLSKLRQKPQQPASAAPQSAMPKQTLPEIATSAEDALRQDLEARGQFLARQDQWSELSAEIRRSDQDRRRTPGGMAYADLLARGARLDVVQPIEQILRDPALMPQHAPKNGVAEFEALLEEHPEDFGVALVVVKTHIDIAWAWRGDLPASQLAPLRLQQFQRHMDRAMAILDAFSPFEHDSPALAACRCALLAATTDADRRMADDYEDLIDLDPGNPRHMRAFGNHLLPRWFGSYQMLEVEARRVALITQDLWGAGGYAWVYLDALSLDPGALEFLDADFFLEGMRDILDAAPDQHVVNTWAAFCAVTLPSLPKQRRQGQDVARLLQSALTWIKRDHLREVHPLIWGQASLGFDSRSFGASFDAIADMGRDAARRALAAQPA